MPELPEVETTRRGIAPAAVGQTVATVEIHDPRLRWPVPGELPDHLAGAVIRRVDRRSRYLLLRCERDDDAGTLLVHLGMTGSLRLYSAAPPARQKHDHLEIVFANGWRLRYHDPRRFGAVLWFAGHDDDHPLLAELGPEPLSADFSGDALYAALRNRSIAIKLAVMDNSVVCGVGNIYANESLFRAGIHPERAANRVGRERCDKLAQTIKEVLTEAIAKGGSTLRDYVDAAGEPGYFQLDYYAYGRAGEPCRICGTTMRLLRQGGRATTFCPACQR